MKYKLQENGVFDTEENMSIPNATGNRHWQEYLAWVAEGNTPDPEFSATEIETKRIADIKALAGRKIIEVLPEWKQRNLLARSVELNNKVITGGTLTTEEQAEMTAITAAWSFAKATRVASNEAEANGAAADNIVWPV